MSASGLSWIPSKEAIELERARRAARGLSELIASLDDPQMPPWPSEADADPELWKASHWSRAAIERFETLERALYFETMDTVMGALALAVWEVGDDESAVAALLHRCGLPCWPRGAAADEMRILRRDHWGAWESHYYDSWREWAPLDLAGRRAAHIESWREHLASEAMEVRSHGECWWRTMTMPKPERAFARVDTTAGLRLAGERAHDETYPRPTPSALEAWGRGRR